MNPTVVDIRVVERSSWKQVTVSSADSAPLYELVDLSQVPRVYPPVSVQRSGMLCAFKNVFDHVVN
jgi:hypothetical protein